MSDFVRVHALIVGAAACTCAADFVPVDHGQMSDPVYGEGGTPAVMPAGKTSLSLMMYAGGNSQYVNDAGDVAVSRGMDAFTDIGANINGTGRVLAMWDEFEGEGSNTIQIVWKTSNAEELLPAGSEIDGNPASFLGWAVGASSAIPFGDWIDPSSIEIVNATIAFSSNEGGSFDIFNISATLDDPWNGTDTGSALPMAGEHVNYIVAQYQYAFVPVPGTAGVLLLGLALTRRRR